MKKRELTISTPPSGLEIFHLGPGFEEGPLPALFYFALSGEDSLLLDPYNQPAALLSEVGIRVFSFSLPFHQKQQDYQHAMAAWAGQIPRDPYFLEKFFDLCLQNIDHLRRQKLIDPKRLAVAGLSRGGFIAAHLAARNPHIPTVLGFAPLISLELLPEFKGFEGDPIVQALNLNNHVDKLVHKHIRYYIGNRDVRVCTDRCFHFISKLADTAYERGVRSPQAELILFPSIGHKGHGTPPDIFKAGADWLYHHL